MMFWTRGECAGALAAAAVCNLGCNLAKPLAVTLVSAVVVSTASHLNSTWLICSSNQICKLKIVNSQLLLLRVGSLCGCHSKYLLEFCSKSYSLNVRVQKKPAEECDPASQLAEPGQARCRKGHKALKCVLTVVDPGRSLARRISPDHISLF